MDWNGNGGELPEAWAAVVVTMTPTAKHKVRYRALQMRREGVPTAQVIAQLHISTALLTRWLDAERAEQARAQKAANLTPPPYCRGYRWGAGV